MPLILGKTDQCTAGTERLRQASGILYTADGRVRVRWLSCRNKGLQCGEILDAHTHISDGRRYELRSAPSGLELPREAPHG